MRAALTHACTCEHVHTCDDAFEAMGNLCAKLCKLRLQDGFSKRLREKLQTSTSVFSE